MKKIKSLLALTIVSLAIFGGLHTVYAINDSQIGINVEDKSNDKMPNVVVDTTIDTGMIVQVPDDPRDYGVIVYGHDEQQEETKNNKNLIDPIVYVGIGAFIVVGFTACYILRKKDKKFNKTYNDIK